MRYCCGAQMFVGERGYFVKVRLVVGSSQCVAAVIVGLEVSCSSAHMVPTASIALVGERTGTLVVLSDLGMLLLPSFSSYAVARSRLLLTPIQLRQRLHQLQRCHR